MKRDLRTWLQFGIGFLIVALMLTDCFGGHSEHVPAVVTGRLYKPPYDELVCSTDPQTKILSCHNVHHSADYTLYVTTSEGSATLDTNAQGYATVQEQQPISYWRRRTRWSNYTWGASYYPD